MADAETTASKPQEGNQSVQLGIGTLIAIALIVSMCSGRSEAEKIQKDTAQLKQQLGVIEQKLDALVASGSARGAAGSPGSAVTLPEAPEAASPSP